MKYCVKCQNSFSDMMDVCPNDGTALSDFDLNSIVGQTIDGKYQIESLLGGGGMGAVFRARHTFLNNEVAIKIIHRDLKPDNIMIKQNDLGQLVIKVLDFGIAKIKTPEESSTSLTREGSIIGTLNYMSPEQCRGEELIDGRSDIYSLGVVVFE